MPKFDSVSDLIKAGVRIPEGVLRELKATDKTQKKNKYNAKKAELEGIVFDSYKEMSKYAELRVLQKMGQVKSIELQPEFQLQEGYIGPDGKKVRPIIYRADFLVTYADGQQVVIDTKGFKTPVYAMKKKMLLKRYPHIRFVEE